MTRLATRAPVLPLGGPQPVHPSTTGGKLVATDEAASRSGGLAEHHSAEAMLRGLWY